MQVVSIAAARCPGLAPSSTVLVEIVVGVLVKMPHGALMVPGVIRGLVRTLVSVFGPPVISAFGIAPGMRFVAGRILRSLISLPLSLISLLMLRPSRLGIMRHGGNGQRPEAQG